MGILAFPNEVIVGEVERRSVMRVDDDVEKRAKDGKDVTTRCGLYQVCGVQRWLGEDIGRRSIDLLRHQDKKEAQDFCAISI